MAPRRQQSHKQAPQLAIPKRKNRLQKILVAQRVPNTRLQAIYVRNASTSPLLHLPAEIRNRIWRYVLGGHVVHIELGLGQTGVLHRICDTEDTCHTSEDICSDTQRPIIPRTYAARHGTCGLLNSKFWPEAPVGYLSLSALRVCRQVHQEAALLPYSDNTFSFHIDTYSGTNIRILEPLVRFVKKLAKEQASAIRTIIYARNNEHGVTHNDKHLKYLIANLTGLRSVICVVEFCGTRRAALFAADSTGERERQGRDLLVFKSFPLASVKVRGRNAEAWFRSQKDPRFAAISPDVLRVWEVKMERQILGDDAGDGGEAVAR